MVSFILLRRNFPHIDRPYRSPLGIPGAALAIVVSVATLVMLFLNSDYRLGVGGAALWFLCGILYFASYARKRLILSPEEEFAMTHRQPSKVDVTA